MIGERRKRWSCLLGFMQFFTHTQKKEKEREKIPVIRIQSAFVAKNKKEEKKKKKKKT